MQTKLSLFSLALLTSFSSVITPSCAVELGFMGEERNIIDVEYYEWLDGMITDDTENVWIVDFYIETCPYCKAFAPMFVETANLCADNGVRNIKFAKINVAHERYLTYINGVKSVPSVKGFARDKQK